MKPRKPTDTERLNWILHEICGSSQNGEPWYFSFRLPYLEGWEGQNTNSHRRREIDAAIRGRKKGG